MPSADAATALFQTKLQGLVRSIIDDGLELVDAPGGAGGIVASGQRSEGFLLLVADPKTGSQIRAIGQALVWASRFEVEKVHLLAESGCSADLARRARYFVEGEPSIQVWSIEGTELHQPAPADLILPPVLDPGELEFAPLMRAAGTRPVDDFARLVAEVAGLEVARVSTGDHGSYLEVGVGQADRELQLLVHGGLERQEALERAVGLVLDHRRPNAPLHPLNRLARERWLRSEILDRPDLLGLARAEPLPPLRPRATLLGTEPCAAIGFDNAGVKTVVVCSVGIDVDLAAEAADYRERTAPEASLTIVVPARDQHRAIVRTLDRLNQATLMSFPPPWGSPL